MATEQHYRSTSSELALDSQESAGFVLGVDIGGTQLRLALADMQGSILARFTASTAGVRDPAVVVQRIRDGAESLLKERSLPLASVRAIAAGAPGVTDAEQGVVIATSYLMGWRNVPLQALMEAAFGVPAAIENDVNMAALGESRGGAARGVRDFVFFAAGTGIGAGIVLNHQLHQGRGWSAGEVGYMLVPGTDLTPSEPHQPGALEQVAGGEGVKLQWQTRWAAAKTSLPRDAMASEIFDHAAEGNPLAQEVLGLAAQTMAYAIYNTWLMLNCDLFVLGGTVGLHPVFANAVRARLDRQCVRAKPQLICSALGPDAQLIGAIFLAIETSEKRGLARPA